MPGQDVTAEPQLESSGWLIARIAVLVVGAALCAAPLAGHSDEVDPHTYTVLARHLVGSATWVDPTYLPSVFARFREHLPFALWPWALAIQLFGERALVPLALLFSLGLLALLLGAGTPVFGRTAALIAALLLACTESFLRYAAQTRLDILLLLLTTAATLPLFRPVALRRSHWAWAATLTALAVLVKGPFGLLPLAAATCARAVVLRSARELLPGSICLALAALPAVAFLALDAWLGDGSWWTGYGRNQLFASAIGMRADGEQGLVPIKCIAGRFWPGLPLAAAGIVAGLRDLARQRPTPAAVVAVHCLVGLALLCLPSRQIWHHALILFPPLALLAGSAAAPVLDRLIASAKRRRAALMALVAAAALTSGAAMLGAGAWLTPRVCVLPTKLTTIVPWGAEVLLVAPSVDWRVIAALAAEYGLDGWPVTSFGGERDGASWALVRAGTASVPHAGWSERARENAWELWSRDP